MNINNKERIMRKFVVAIALLSGIAFATLQKEVDRLRAELDRK